MADIPAESLTNISSFDQKFFGRLLQDETGVDIFQIIIVFVVLI